MAFPAVECFRGSSVPLEQTNKPKALQCDQKAALITDFVVATLFVTVGILALIQITGLADLGALSGFGSIGPTAAYAMILTGVAIVAVDLVTLMIKQARFISKLQSLSTARNGEEAEASRQLGRMGDKFRYEERIEEMEEQIRGEEGRTRTAVQLSTEDLNRQIREIRREIEKSKETAAQLDREKDELIKKLHCIDNNARQAGEEHEREIKGLREKLRVANLSSEETERKQKKRIEELTLKLQRAEEKARQAGEEHEREIKGLREKLESAQLSDQKLRIERERELEECKTEIHRLKDEIRKKQEAAKTDVVLPSTLEFEEEEKKPVGGLLTASLLVRRKLDLGSLKAPQMKAAARKYVLHLADTPKGLSKIRGAVQGFQNYLEKKVKDLKAKPSSDDNVGAFGLALVQDLNNSLFGSVIFDEDISIKHSFMTPVAEEIDLEDLDSNLEEYFITLAEWIKEGGNPNEQIKRTEVAMEKFTSELIDAVNEKSKKRLEETKSRLEGEHVQRLKEIEMGKEELARSQRARIEQALILSPNKEDHYDLRSLSFEKVDKAGEMQIKSALIETFKKDTIEKLMLLKKAVVEKADHLLKLDLREDNERDIKELEQASNNLIGYIQTINRSCKKVKYDDILERV